MEEDLDFETDKIQIFTTQICIQEIHIYLNVEIETPRQFGEVNQLLKELGAEDEAHLYINCTGGNLSTTIEFINNINACEAQVIGHLTGEACSAAGMIFLACDSWDLHPLSTLMIHSPTAGAEGPVTNLKIQADQLVELSNRVIRQYYKGFLTDEEILVEDLKETYMFCEEIQERLINLQNYRASLEDNKEDKGEE